jgi:hypothetical protein
MRVVDCTVERVDAPGWSGIVDEVGAGGTFGVTFLADEAGWFFVRKGGLVCWERVVVVVVAYA